MQMVLKKQNKLQINDRIYTDRNWLIKLCTGIWIHVSLKDLIFKYGKKTNLISSLREKGLGHLYYKIWEYQTGAVHEQQFIRCKVIFIYSITRKTLVTYEIKITKP